MNNKLILLIFLTFSSISYSSEARVNGELFKSAIAYFEDSGLYEGYEIVEMSQVAVPEEHINDFYDKQSSVKFQVSHRGDQLKRCVITTISYSTNSSGEYQEESAEYLGSFCPF